MTGFKVDPIVIAGLGLPATAAQDANALWVAVMNKCGGKLQAVLDRAVKRTGLHSVDVPNHDPEGEHRAARVDLTSHAGGVHGTGVRLAFFITHSPTCAEVFVDEGKNYCLGLPIGPPAKALDAPLSEKTSDTTVAILGGKPLDGSRGFLEGLPFPTPFDIAVIGLVAVLIPIVLPLIISLGGAVISFVGGIISPKPAASSAAPPPAPNPIDAAAQKAGIEPAGSDTASKVALVGALLVVAYVVIRHFKHKAG